jgi:hypothetical protein
MIPLVFPSVVAQAAIARQIGANLRLSALDKTLAN